MIIDLFLYIFKKGKMYGRSENVVSRGSGDQDQSGLKVSFNNHKTVIIYMIYSH